MRALILAVATCLLLTTSALAGYEEGMRAYWRGDYAGALSEFRPLADAGDAEAQFMLGEIYASGRGVPQDFVEAHLWYNLAASGGNGRAMQAREQLASRMTPTQVAEAQRRARDWRPAEAAAAAPAATIAGPPAAARSERARGAEVQRQLGRLN